MPTRRRFLWTAAATAPALALLPLSAQEKPAGAKDAEGLPPAIAVLTNRTKQVVPIPVQERESRIERARELMKQNKMDAVVMTTGSSLHYFTGGRWGQSERLFAYVLPAAAAPFVVCPYFERDRLAEMMATFPERETTLSFLWQENDDPYALLHHGLAEAGVATGAIGIEEHTQFAFAHAIAVASPALKFVSATPVTAGCRARKSAAELALLRLANSITWDVYKAAYQSCGPGDTNQHFSDVVAKGYARCGVRGEASCQVGESSAVPHGTSRPQTIREGEMVLIDDGCTVEGYTSDISRSFVYGRPTDLHRTVFDHVHKAQAAALAAARPGVEMQAVDAAARGVVSAAGYGPGFTYFTHRVGHGIGLDMHEWPYLVPGNTQKLAAGMVFSDEPGIYLPGRFGVRLEDDMHITEEGAEWFTPQSPSLKDPFGVGGAKAG